MNRSRYERAADIFSHAVLMPEGERTQYVDHACDGDADLRQTVDRLLDADTGDSFLDSPYREPTEQDWTDVDPALITAIGAYRVQRVIARGGMGTVFLAQQENPQRDVAVKLFAPDLRLSDATGHEAAALGRLRHPGIARVLEAGTATVSVEGGRSFDGAFMAMEYIEGRTLGHARPTERREIMRLLSQIAEAVEHAHQRGVIHRDLKPSNIVVCNEGRPHLIDFGVGLVRDDEHESHDEAPGGTLAYMAPEQMLGTPDQIDTRVDVYAIGAIGYELVMGRRLNAAAESLDSAALQRMIAASRIDRDLLRRRCGHELAAVLAKATSPDPDDRYSSAGDLAADIHRALDGLPVAGETTPFHRVITLHLLRNRLLAAVAAVASLLIVSAVVGMAMATARATDAAASADASLRLANEEAIHAEKLASFLQASFLGVDPEERGAELTLLEAIDYAAGRVSRDLGDTPAAEADVRFAIGFVYRRQGRLRAAMEQVRLCHALNERLYPRDDPRVLASREEIGYLTLLYGGDAEGARDHLRGVLDTQLEAGDGRSASSAWVRMKLANATLESGDHAEADRLLAEAEPLMVEHYGAPYAARTTRQRALVAMHRDDEDAAVSLARRAILLCENMHEQEYIVARSRLTLAVVLREAGVLEEAALSLDTANRMFSGMLTRDSIELFDVLEERARLALLRGDHEAALQLARELAEGRRRVLAPAHPDIASADALVRLCLAAAADGPDREGLIQAASAVVERAFVAGHPDLAFVQARAAALRGTPATGSIGDRR